MLEIPDNLEIVTSCKYHLKGVDNPFCMVQIPFDGFSLFQFQRSENKDVDMLNSNEISSIMSDKQIAELIEVMRQQTEHHEKLEFTDGDVKHYIITRDKDEFVLLFQLIVKYFQPICVEWKRIYNMQRLQAEMQKKALQKQQETQSEEDKPEAKTDSNE